MANENQKNEKLPRNISQVEIAHSTAGRDITRGFVDPMLVEANPDSVLNSRGRDLQVYEEIKRDSQVISGLSQRFESVVQAEYRVEPGGTAAVDAEAAEFAQQQLDALGWDNVTSKMLWGRFYGYGVAELLWAPVEGGRWGWSAIKVRNRRRFGFRPNGELRLLTFDQPLVGEPAPAPYFWHYQTGDDHDDNHYGLGLGHWLYWPVFFKRHDIKYWAVFVEKFAAPTVVGQFEEGATDDDRARLLAAARSVGIDAAVVHPSDMSLELIEAARSGTGASNYKELHDVMDRSISKIILGQTMTTDDGSSRSQAQVHMSVRQDLVKADSDLINESFRCGPLTWLTRYNFPTAQVPMLVRDIDPPEDQDLASQRDERLHGMGWSLTEEQATGDELAS